MLHVAQLIDGIGIGGAEKLLVTFAKVAPQYQIKTTVISLHPDWIHGPFIEELKAHGVTVRFFPARYLSDPKRLRKIIGYLQHEPFDVLHTHLTYGNIIGALAGRLVGLPVVASLHSAHNQPPLSRRPHQQLESWALRYGVRAVIGVGQAVAEAHQARVGRKPIIVIPNAVETTLPTLSMKERTALRTELVGDANRPLIISVGRLTKPKNLADLLTAFAKLRVTHPTAALIIAGDGGLRQALARQIQTLNLTGHAILLGARSDVPRLLLASDIFASSSLWEGLPVAVLEAMAASLPIVATSVGELPQLIVKGTGLIVPPRKPAALAEALRTLLDNPSLRESFGMAARAKVSRDYNAQTWVARLKNIYTAQCNAGSS